MGNDSCSINLEHVVPSSAEKNCSSRRDDLLNLNSNLSGSIQTPLLAIMYINQVSIWLCCVSVLQLTTAFSLDTQPLAKRVIQKGWALAQSTCPTNSNSCGDGSCCPSNLFCFQHGNLEIASCCPTSKESMEL